MPQTYVMELPHIVGVAIDVLCGSYGSGEERKKALESRGYDYAKVQACVNDICKLIEKYQEV